MNAVLEALQISKFWPQARGQGPRTAVDQVSLSLEQGQALGIVGESGSGKSTLARILVGAYSPDGGSLLLKGQKLCQWTLQSRASLVQMVFQDPSSALHPRHRIRTQLEEPLRYVLGWQSKAIETRVGELLEAVQLSKQTLDLFPHELSGGQKQRVCIARALVLKPDILICDEPVSSLDRLTQLEILQLLQSWRRDEGGTLILISHDLGVVRHMCEQIAVMHQGRFIEQGDTHTLFAKPLHPYTRLLLQSMPRLYRQQDYGDWEVKSDELGAAGQPESCKWAPDCPFAKDICERSRPRLRPFSSSQAACHRLEELPWNHGPS